MNEAANAQLIVGGAGKLAIAYMGTTNSPGAPFPRGPSCVPDINGCLSNDKPGYNDTTWNGYVVLTTTALDEDPLFYTATLNPPTDPLIRGSCGPTRCQEAHDFLDVRIAPDGMPWASFIDGCTGACGTGASKRDNDDEGLAGRLWGGPSLNWTRRRKVPRASGTNVMSRPRTPIASHAPTPFVPPRPRPLGPRLPDTGARPANRPDERTRAATRRPNGA